MTREENSRCFYRAVSAREYLSWRETGKLGANEGHIESGKHLTTSADYAEMWWQRFKDLGQESGDCYVLQITFPEEVERGLVHLGPRIDGIGPAYFATLEQMELASITTVPRGGAA